MNEKSQEAEVICMARDIIKYLCIVIIILIISIAATNVYHIYKWSEFDTVYIDSEKGNANYIDENGNSIDNGGKEDGENSSEKEKKVE